MRTFPNHLLGNMNPWLIGLIVAWSLVWKGWALWRAARLNHLGWYIFLLIFNIVGIPEIIYIAATHKRYSELNSRIR